MTIHTDDELPDATLLPGIAGMVSRLVSGQAGFRRALGQVDDVDLPAQRHVYLQLFLTGT